MAVVIPYTKQTWTDGVSSCSAARNNVHEDGINDAHFQPCVRVYNSANISVAVSGTAQALAFNSERYDQAGNVASTMHDTVTNNTRLTCRYAGVYAINGQAVFAANATGTRELWIRLNGATLLKVEMFANNGAGANVFMGAATDYALAANDYVELMAVQSSGGALNVLSLANYSPEFMMHRVG